MEKIELQKTIWSTAKKLRTSIGLYEGMHVVLGLVFLKYITDTCEDKPDESDSKPADVARTNDPEREEYISYNEFFVPRKAQWVFLLNNSRYSEIGILIDEVIDTIEKLNENIRGILPKNYSNHNIDKAILGELVRLIGGIGCNKKDSEKKESLAEAFDYILRRFAANSDEADQFYPPGNIVRLLVEMVGPRKGIIYDTPCGAGNMFVHIDKHIKKYRAKIDNLTFEGRDKNDTIIKIAKMNLFLNDLNADLKAAETFADSSYPDFRADFIFASPTPNQSDWNTDTSQNHHHWSFGLPPDANGNYAWLQHYVSKLSGSGIAGIILPDNSLNSNSGEEKKIRQGLIEANLVDCIVTLPSKLFAHAEDSACIWILTKNKINNKYTNPNNEVLFINARNLRVTPDRELTDESLLLISRSYQRWRNINGDYMDRKGFCKAVTVKNISNNKFNLNPARYVEDSSRTKKNVISTVLVASCALVFFLSNFKNSPIDTKYAAGDTAITVVSKSQKDSLQLQHKKQEKTVKRKGRDKQGKEKDNSALDGGQNKSVAKAQDNKIDTLSTETKMIKKDTLPGKIAEAKEGFDKQQTDLAGNYKVISKAYFYNEPDENTRRNAFINHWNNTYARIEAEDERNGFIYVEFVNHLHQTSKGWLRKKDLTEVNK